MRVAAMGAASSGWPRALRGDERDLAHGAQAEAAALSMHARQVMERFAQPAPRRPRV
ncbi:MAG: hypothetical protein ACKOUS_19700 [Alphaproteobacteria bacterium]